MIKTTTLDPTDLKIYHEDAFRKNVFYIIHYSSRYVNIRKC